MKKQCRECGQGFDVTFEHRKYCCFECQAIHWRRKYGNTFTEDYAPIREYPVIPEVDSTYDGMVRHSGDVISLGLGGE